MHSTLMLIVCLFAVIDKNRSLFLSYFYVLNRDFVYTYFINNTDNLISLSILDNEFFLSVFFM